MLIPKMNKQTSCYNSMLKFKTNRPRGCWEQYAFEQASSTNKVLVEFAAATQKKFAEQDSRLGNLESDVTSCETSNADMQKQILAIEEEQRRQVVEQFLRQLRP